MEKKAPELYKEDRPWGNFVEFIKNSPPSAVKIITVEAGQTLSLQYHHNRQEFWYILSGNGQVTLHDSTVEVHPGDTFFVEKEEKHRIGAGSEQLTFLELAYGEFDEQDIIRLKDNYGRTP
jgi:mannose-6-phosphate isomerase-like protein (cupin superfamily)